MVDIVFSLILGRNDLRGIPKAFGIKPLKYYIHH
jgi:hypothetical protein